MTRWMSSLGVRTMSSSPASYAAWAWAGSVVMDMSISVRVGLTSPDQFGFGLRTIWLL